MLKEDNTPALTAMALHTLLKISTTSNPRQSAVLLFITKKKEILTFFTKTEMKKDTVQTLNSSLPIEKYQSSNFSPVMTEQSLPDFYFLDIYLHQHTV